MDGDLEDEVVVGTSWCSQIPDSHVTVRADCTDHAVCMRTPLHAVCARMGGKSEQALFSFWIPYLD